MCILIRSIEVVCKKVDIKSASMTKLMTVLSFAQVPAWHKEILALF